MHLPQPWSLIPAVAPDPGAPFLGGPRSPACLGGPESTAAVDDDWRPAQPADPPASGNLPPSVDMARPESPLPPVIWHPAHQGNRIQANRPLDLPILWLLLYLSGRPTLDSIRTYRIAPTGHACHFLVSGAGERIQMLAERDWAPLTDVRSVDQRSITIEVEAEGGVVEEAAYRATAALVGQLAERYGIPVERSRILGAHEVADSKIAPAPIALDWDRLLSEALGGAPIIVDATMEGRFFASSTWTRMMTSSERRGAFFAVAPAGASGDGAQYRARFPQTGLYEVSVWYPASPDACPATPIVLYTAKGQELIQIDQRQGGGRWESLGIFPFQAGDYWAASISRSAQAQGIVIADSIRFLPMSGRRDR